MAILKPAEDCDPMHLLRCYYENGETKVGAVNASPYSRCTAKFDDAWQHLVDDGYIEYVDARHTRITEKGLRALDEQGG
jgi:hypothetical protein